MIDGASLREKMIGRWTGLATRKPYQARPEFQRRSMFILTGIARPIRPLLLCEAAALPTACAMFSPCSRSQARLYWSWVLQAMKFTPGKSSGRPSGPGTASR